MTSTGTGGAATGSAESAAERLLPIRVGIQEGEGLDSWLEALARRNGLSISKLLTGLGLPGTEIPHRLVLTADERLLRRLERQAVLPTYRLDLAVLDRFVPTAVGRAARPARHVVWHAQPNSFRYCPACLADSDGRWPLIWRLNWSFACTRHHALLRETCPGCGQPPRGYHCAGGPNPPATCARSASKTRRCGADLRDATCITLAPDDPLLAAQRRIHHLLTDPPTTADAATSANGEHSTSTHSTSPHSTHSDTDRLEPRAVMRKLSTITRWLLRLSGEHEFDAFAPSIQRAWRYYRAQTAGTGHRAGWNPPTDIALTGALASQAIALIDGPETEATSHMRELISRATTHYGRRQPPAMTTPDWLALSPTVQGRFLRALDPYMSSLERIRHRSPTPRARVPTDTSERLAARARHLPQLLWPHWAIRLMPPQGVLDGPFRATLCALMLLPGNPNLDKRQLLDTLHPYRSTFAVNTLLKSLAEPANRTVFAAICQLADYLDEQGSRIDYARRRRVVSPDVLTREQWRQLCYRRNEHPGDDSQRRQRRHTHAQRYLCQLLTGADLSDPRHPLVFTGPGDRSRYLLFTDSLAPPLRQALHEHAEDWLREAGIDEPLTWQPPPSCCTGLALPGRDPEDIDPQAVHQLVVTQGLPPGAAAEQLGTTISHVRLALEHLDRPARQWRRPYGPVAWQQRHRADTLLTREFFDREYLHAGKTLRQLAAETGFSRQMLAEYARNAGLDLQHARIDPDWLREQYLHRKHSYTDIAAELGVTDVTVIAAARRHGIPSRPKGVHSRPDLIRKLDTHIPRIVRRAVEGQLHGWLRLKRFQTAMTFPTVVEAARHLHAEPSALNTQFYRLERDIGAPLYHRSTPKEPLRPTRRGQALLDALQQPAVAELMHQYARAPAPPRNPRPRRPTTRPPSPREQSQAFYATLTLEKIRITHAVRRTLSVFLDHPAEDLYGLQITQLTGLHAGTLYPLLARLAATGWVTSHPESHQAWQAANPPGQMPHRPRRTYHQLTDHGRQAALHELATTP